MRNRQAPGGRRRRRDRPLPGVAVDPVRHAAQCVDGCPAAGPSGPARWAPGVAPLPRLPACVRPSPSSADGNGTGGPDERRRRWRRRSALWGPDGDRAIQGPLEQDDHEECPGKDREEWAFRLQEARHEQGGQDHVEERPHVLSALRLSVTCPPRRVRPAPGGRPGVAQKERRVHPTTRVPLSERTKESRFVDTASAGSILTTDSVVISRA